jgi:predicted O-linked N-acetylglucosamine transferase (SPINDLY family)
MPERTPSEVFNLALGLHKSGQLAEAERLYRQILAQNPNQPQVLHMLGVLAHQAGQNAAAEGLIRRAIALQPTVPAYHGNLGKVLGAQGRLDEAIAAYRHVVTVQPTYAEGFNNLASLLLDAGRNDEAMDAARHALGLKPDYPEAHYNLGAALRNKGDFLAAARAFESATQVRQDYAEAFNALGDAQAKSGKTDHAITAFNRAVAIRPNFPEAYNNLGNTLRDVQRLREASEAYLTALGYRPADPVVLNNLGTLLEGIPDTAEKCIGVYHRALAIDPNLATAHYNLANALRKLGRLDEAVTHFRKSWDLKPDHRAADNLLYMIHLHPDFGPPEIAAEHRRWNEQFVRPLAQRRRPHTNSPDPDRALKIGYVSPDFREHPVGRFLLPLLRHHDRARFKIHCYSDVKRESPATAPFRELSDVWRQTASVSDDALADLIRADGIDILIDLAMHMEDNRMFVFARKPAPVQASYLAFNSTTGNEAIDYRITDSYFDPPGLEDPPYVEKPVRLRSYWCYSDPEVAPPPAPPPSLSTGHVTFGCLNSFSKATTLALKTWARLLKSLPGSRLVLHTLAGAHHKSVLSRFGQEGVDPARLDLVGYLPFEDYFKTHHRIDVALDPFPYPGGTTTFDAIWMGVPVVTLAGRTTVSRGGVSILSNLGFPQWVAHDQDQYIQSAQELARSVDLRKDLRNSLRERLRSSILMNASECTRDLESAYRRMWSTWCARQHLST